MILAGESNRTRFRKRVFKPMLVAEWLEMTIPDKPTSSRQKYRLTATGKALLEAGERSQ